MISRRFLLAGLTSLAAGCSRPSPGKFWTGLSERNSRKAGVTDPSTKAVPAAVVGVWAGIKSITWAEIGKEIGLAAISWAAGQAITSIAGRNSNMSQENVKKMLDAAVKELKEYMKGEFEHDRFNSFRNAFDSAYEHLLTASASEDNGNKKTEFLLAKDKAKDAFKFSEAMAANSPAYLAASLSMELAAYVGLYRLDKDYAWLERFRTSLTEKKQRITELTHEIWDHYIGVINSMSEMEVERADVTTLDEWRIPAWPNRPSNKEACTVSYHSSILGRGDRPWAEFCKPYYMGAVEAICHRWTDWNGGLAADLRDFHQFQFTPVRNIFKGIARQERELLRNAQPEDVQRLPGQLSAEDWVEAGRLFLGETPDAFFNPILDCPGNRQKVSIHFNYKTGNPQRPSIRETCGYDLDDGYFNRTRRRLLRLQPSEANKFLCKSTQTLPPLLNSIFTPK